MIYQKGHVPRDITITIIRSLSQYNMNTYTINIAKATAWKYGGSIFEHYQVISSVLGFKQNRCSLIKRIKQTRKYVVYSK